MEADPNVTPQMRRALNAAHEKAREWQALDPGTQIGGEATKQIVQAAIAAMFPVEAAITPRVHVATVLVYAEEQPAGGWSAVTCYPDGKVGGHGYGMRLPVVLGAEAVDIAATTERAANGA